MTLPALLTWESTHETDCFACWAQSKYGKPASAALRIADSNTFPFPEGFTNDSFHVPDMEKRVQQGHDELWEDNELDMEAEIKKFQSAGRLELSCNCTCRNFGSSHE